MTDWFVFMWIFGWTLSQRCEVTVVFRSECTQGKCNVTCTWFLSFYYFSLVNGLIIKPVKLTWHYLVKGCFFQGNVDLRTTPLTDTAPHKSIQIPFVTLQPNIWMCFIRIFMLQIVTVKYFTNRNQKTFGVHFYCPPRTNETNSYCQKSVMV